MGRLTPTRQRTTHSWAGHHHRRGSKAAVTPGGSPVRSLLVALAEGVSLADPRGAFRRFSVGMDDGRAGSRCTSPSGRARLGEDAHGRGTSETRHRWHWGGQRVAEGILAEALVRAPELERSTCRSVAETQFSTEQMVSEHLDPVRRSDSAEGREIGAGGTLSATWAPVIGPGGGSPGWTRTNNPSGTGRRSPSVRAALLAAGIGHDCAAQVPPDPPNCRRNCRPNCRPGALPRSAVASAASTLPRCVRLRRRFHAAPEKRR
jgi:hypothetical protein